MEQEWIAILARITQARPEPVDALIRGGGPASKAGKALFPDDLPAGSVALFPQRDDTLSYIGIRLTEPLDDPASTALRLISAALERQVVPIVLSRLDNCGLERFGIRVERIPGGRAEAATAEAQLARFWNLAIIIDGRDVARLA